MIAEILAVVVIVWLLLRRWQQRDVYRLAALLKNSYTALPLIGHTYMAIGSNEDRMNAFKKFSFEAMKNKRGMTAVWFGANLNIVVADAEVAKELARNCLEKTDMLVRELIGNGSIYAPVKIWRPRRKLVLPVFSKSNMSGFRDIFARESTALADKLEAHVDGKSFALESYLLSYTLNSIFEVALGGQVMPQKYREFVEAFETYFHLLAARMGQPWLRCDAIYQSLPIYKCYTEQKQTISDFVDEVLRQKRNGFTSQDITESGAKSFLEMMLSSSMGDGSVTDVVIREELLVMLVAASDTTAVGLGFTLLMLARHPDVQEQVYREIQEILPDSTEHPTLNDIDKLKYLDAVIYETLRLYPPGPLVARKLDKDFTLRNGTTLMKDSRVVLSIWGVHRNPRHWGADADRFRPERFLDRPPDQHPAFMGFSSGPRSCSGFKYAMFSMKTLISSLLRRYRLLDACPEPPHEPLRVQYDFTLKHVHHFPVKLEHRHKT